MGEKSRGNFAPGAKMSKALLKDLKKNKEKNKKIIDRTKSKR